MICPTCGHKASKPRKVTASATVDTSGLSDRELSAHYAATSPRLDLAFYLAYAARHIADYDDDTRLIVADMTRLADTLSGTPASQKRIVLADDRPLSRVGMVLRGDVR